MLFRDNFTVSNQVWHAGYTFWPLSPRLPEKNSVDRPGFWPVLGDFPYNFPQVRAAERSDRIMKAIVDGEIVAQSNDVIECKGYQYFPPAAVRMDRLRKADRTADDHACP